MAILSAQDIRVVMCTKGELALRVLPGAKLERAAIENGALKLSARTAPHRTSGWQSNRSGVDASRGFIERAGAQCGVGQRRNE